MNREIIDLIVKAFEREGTTNISFCIGKDSFRDCITNENGQLWLWYNAENQSTKIVK